MKVFTKLIIFLFIFFLLPNYTAAITDCGDADANTWCVETTDTTVDGDTDCGGTCTSADTIIIDGGARGGLRFQDFDGSGSYITITNENVNPDAKVEIDGMVGFGCLSIYNCKYVDLKGNNDADLTYGIKIINDNTSQTPGSVWVYGESDHIKIGYLEITCEGNTSITGNGVFVNDANLTNAWTFDTFEIHHNYIHDTRYAGMYLGHNDASINNKPYVGTFSIHNNLLEDMGSYGITLKSVNVANNYIYNNTIKRTGIVRTDLGDNFKHGVGVQMFNSGYTCEIYGNQIEKTVGSGIKVGGDGHLVYDNIILGCGTGQDAIYAQGIRIYQGAENVEVYDNIIIQAYRYGIYGGGTTASASHKRNLIGDCGSGEAGGTNLTEGTGADANIYHADVADFSFNAWSDNSDYTNDRFRTRNLLPVDNGAGVALVANLTWENFGDITGVDVFFEKDDATPDVKVVDNDNVEIYNPPADLDYNSTYYWQIVPYGGAETEPGAVYLFSTTTQANPPILSGGGMTFHREGMAGVWSRNGVSIK